MPDPLLLVGASVRAAAQSAVRAGFTPLGADLFADRDLRAIAACKRVSRYPDGLLDAAEQLADAPFLYTGALENYPALVDALTGRRTLLGNPGHVLRTIRDPLSVGVALREAGFSVPDVALSADTVPQDGTWLRKPRHSGGGGGILVWDQKASTRYALRNDGADSAGHRREAGPYYFQKRIAGLPCAAVCIAARGRAVLLGLTEQLNGTDWTGAAAFHYAGSIGPLDVADEMWSNLQRLADFLANWFALSGVFGVDGVLADETFWPVEVNPRYPASAEVFERALGFSVIGSHVAACREGVLVAPPRDFATMAGKAIVFARADLAVPERLIEWADAQNAAAHWPLVADIPDAGTTIAMGRPILTVLADGPDRATVESGLRSRVAQVEALLP